jgi:hypothetical protein
VKRRRFVDTSRHHFQHSNCEIRSCQFSSVYVWQQQKTTPGSSLVSFKPFSISLPKYRPSYPEGDCVGTHCPDRNSHLTNLPVGIFLQCLTRPSDGVVQSAFVLVATTLLRYERTRKFEGFAQKAKTMTRAQNGPTPVPLCHWQCLHYHLTERLFVSPADTPLCHGFLATTRQKAWPSNFQNCPPSFSHLSSRTVILTQNILWGCQI